ncbi:MAG: alpha/beta hydrolase family protein [Pseudomonadaceae bacterium]|nr:alpha/beta hydrolase family protein [Pseudomonadaceae bacterium]
MAFSLIGLAATAVAEEAPSDEAADPEPVVRYATFDRQADRSELLAGALPDDEVVVAGEADERHWRVYRTASAAPHGVVVLATAANQPPEAMSVQTVRTLLPRSGWSTLTLALPVQPGLRSPPRQRPTKGNGPAADASEDSQSGDGEAEADEEPGDQRQRREPVPFDRGPLDAHNEGLLSEHRRQVSDRLRDAVADARTRAQGQVVVVMASGMAASEIAVSGADLGADAVVLVDLDVAGAGRESLRRALAELDIPALILQHAPYRWRPEHRLGPRVEMHLMPMRSEARLARRVAGYLKRNYGAR